MDILAGGLCLSLSCATITLFFIYIVLMHKSLAVVDQICSYAIIFVRTDHVLVLGTIQGIDAVG